MDLVAEYRGWNQHFVPCEMNHILDLKRHAQSPHGGWRRRRALAFLWTLFVSFVLEGWFFLNSSSPIGYICNYIKYIKIWESVSRSQILLESVRQFPIHIEFFNYKFDPSAPRFAFGPHLSFGLSNSCSHLIAHPWTGYANKNSMFNTSFVIKLTLHEHV